MTAKLEDFRTLLELDEQMVEDLEIKINDGIKQDPNIIISIFESAINHLKKVLKLEELVASAKAHISLNIEALREYYEEAMYKNEMILD